jgi:hypothetical protein
MIQPTVGRVLWYYDGQHEPGDQPKAATIAHVCATGDHVNIGFLAGNGAHGHETGVFLYQGEGERPERNFCEWMPYKIGQAKKEAAPDEHGGQAKKAADGRSKSHRRATTTETEKGAERDDAGEDVEPREK